MKKVLSLVLALALVLGLAVPAFATDDGTVSDVTKSYTTTITGVTPIPTIKLRIPATGGVVLNPYGMKVSLSMDENGKPQATPDDTDGSMDAIISATQVIESESEMELAVSATVTGKAATGVTFLTKEATNETTNSVYMYVGFKDIISTAAADFDDAVQAATIPSTPVAVAKAGDPSDCVLISSKATTAKVGTLELNASGKKSGLAFKLGGNAVSAPIKPWTDKMTAGATIAFTFSPAKLKGTAASVSLDESTITLIDGTAASKTLTAIFDAGDSGLTVTKYEWSSDDTDTATVTAGGTATDTSTTVTYVDDGIATVTVKATLSDDSTVEATCDVECVSAGDATATVTINSLTLDSSSTTSGNVGITYNAGATTLTAVSYAWETDNACVALSNDTTDTVTVSYSSTGSANVKCVVTLSNGATVTTGECEVTCS